MFFLFLHGEQSPTSTIIFEAKHETKKKIPFWCSHFSQERIFFVFLLYGGRYPRGAVTFEKKYEIEKFVFFLDTKEKPGRGTNIEPELCPRGGYHISGNNKLAREG